ncbi:MAG: protein-glutamate O-methyltransferase [Lentilitoribacter sp.]
MSISSSIMANGSPSEQLVSGESPLTRRDLSDIADMIYADAGIFLNESKASLVYSRLSKRLRKIGLSSFRDYCELVGSERGAEERREMLSQLTTNFTKFYRERHHFEHLASDVLPALISRAKAGGRVRIWSSACSLGHEPYSLAMTILSMFPDAAKYDFRLLASDIDPKVVASASEGIYTTDAIEPVGQQFRNEYFNDLGHGKFQVKDQVKELISFRELNLIANWPFKGKFDVIFCRNVVIYFDDPTQAKIWQRYADVLLKDGYLYIGHSERLSGPAKARFNNVGVTAFRFEG